MKQNMKFILLAVLAVLIAATAFMGGWLASQKAAQPTKAEAHKVESPKAEEKTEEDGKKKGHGEPKAHEPAVKEKTTDEKLADLDFSDGESRVRGRALLSKKVGEEGEIAVQKLEEEKEESKKKRQLEKSVQDWLTRTK